MNRVDNCLFCSKLPVGNVGESFNGAVLKIFEVLFITKNDFLEVVNVGGLKFCGGCQKLVREVKALVEQVKKCELLIQSKVEEVVELVNNVVPADSSGSTGNASSSRNFMRRNVIWEKFRQPVMTKYINGVVPNPSVRMIRGDYDDLLDKMGIEVEDRPSLPPSCRVRGLKRIRRTRNPSQIQNETPSPAKRSRIATANGRGSGRPRGRAPVAAKTKTKRKPLIEMAVTSATRAGQGKKKGGDMKLSSVTPSPKKRSPITWKIKSNVKKGVNGKAGVNKSSTKTTPVKEGRCNKKKWNVAEMVKPSKNKTGIRMWLPGKGLPAKAKHEPPPKINGSSSVVKSLTTEDSESSLFTRVYRSTSATDGVSKMPDKFQTEAKVVTFDMDCAPATNGHVVVFNGSRKMPNAAEPKCIKSDKKPQSGVVRGGKDKSKTTSTSHKRSVLASSSEYVDVNALIPVDELLFDSDSESDESEDEGGPPSIGLPESDYEEKMISVQQWVNDYRIPSNPEATYAQTQDVSDDISPIPFHVTLRRVSRPPLLGSGPIPGEHISDDDDDDDEVQIITLDSNEMENNPKKSVPVIICN